ncbi:MoaD/ThiS family protein [Polaribacter sp.]|uniref:MoaD/ThiS family protein n=1 Tax=Polaribacter sp. TaxID=1920175 RepID=UPI003F6B39FC
MITIEVLFFGITTDLVGRNQVEITIEKSISVAEFKTLLSQKYPNLKNIASYAIAVNESYAEDTSIIKKDDVVAIIPPVSGG